ncbi:hypothetical protein OIU77_015309 [Salix suchowensis]|uniref:DUF7032 domain-containing protein n=1 Tax=Salix suchowensis TaxID=1278906 RepID=A0ABQ8ZSV7_9ROSI|nr:hypothetical protein OIU77_015309 [Salix suchowensis]
MKNNTLRCRNHVESTTGKIADHPSPSSLPLVSLPHLSSLQTPFVSLSSLVSPTHRAEKCQDTNLTKGKQKTQSDIDSILAKLNQNVKDCEILIKSGVLQDGIVSGSGSKRELVRAESRNLITRLQIGSPESKNLAMDSVLSLIQEDDKNVMIVVAQGLVSDGFVVRLVAMLNLGVLGVRIAAARAVSELCCNTKTRKEIGDLGCIGPLIKMLDGKAMEEKEAASKTLSLLLLKQMIVVGASVHLKKLVDMNVEGSKKLLDGLGRGKIWGVFARH